MFFSKLRLVSFGLLFLILRGGRTLSKKETKNKMNFAFASDLVNNSKIQSYFLLGGDLVNNSKIQKQTKNLWGKIWSKSQNLKISKLNFDFGVRTQEDPVEPRRAQASLGSSRLSCAPPVSHALSILEI